MQAPTLHCLSPTVCFLSAPLPTFTPRRPYTSLPTCPSLRLHACTNPIRATLHPLAEQVDTSALRGRAAREWGIHLDPGGQHVADLEVLHNGIGMSESRAGIDTDTDPSPLLIRHRKLLSADQCDALVQLQASKTRSADEADLYLNYRVNQAVGAVGDGQRSDEAAALIAATELSSSSQLHAGSRSGFRARVDPEAPAVGPVLDRLGQLLGFAQAKRRWVFEEGAWVRPNRRQVVVRDVTTVHYEHGEGVAPHVDGKDLTVLICLAQPQQGGETVFTTEGLAVPPLQGQALVYCSKTSMAHFAQPVEDGVKWVMQLLIDHKVRADELDVDYRTGQVPTTNTGR